MASTATTARPTVAFAHLGCEKNRVDTEHMLGLLAQAGYGVSADEADAQVVVVNTCSFIQDARAESVRTLVDLAEQGKQIVIAGCLAQHFQEELLESLPEARAIVGTGDYQHIVEVLEQVEAGERVNRVSQVPTFVADENLPRYRTTSEAVAYLKVAEGCDYRCAFCIIPKLRGDQRSRPPAPGPDWVSPGQCDGEEARRSRHGWKLHRSLSAAAGVRSCRGSAPVAWLRAPQRCCLGCACGQ